MEKGKEVIERSSKEMEASLARFRENLSHLRAGRASVGLVNHIPIDAYEDRMPLRQIANITTPDAATILITPYDRGTVKSIEKGIAAADIGLTPISDGHVLRINIPPLTEDRRKEILKVASKVGEEGRVMLRNLRRDAKDELKKLESAKELGEDEYHYFVDELDKVLNDYMGRVDKLLAEKEHEILEG